MATVVIVIVLRRHREQAIVEFLPEDEARSGLNFVLVGSNSGVP